MGRYPLYRGLGGPQDRCLLVRNISHLSVCDPQTVHSFILWSIIFRRVRKILKSDYYFMSIRLHGTIQLPMDGLSWNLILEYPRKLCRENSSFIKVWQQGFYTNDKTHFYRISLSSSYNEKCLRQKLQRKSKHNFMFNNSFRKSCRLWDNVDQ